MSRDSAKEAVALILHKWYSGYDMDKCPNGPTCGLYQSCRDISDKVVNVTKMHLTYEDA